VCITIITFILLFNITAAILVTGSVIVSLVNILGCMNWLNLNLSVMTASFLIVSMGMIIDFAAHIGQGFLKNKATSRQAKVSNTLKELGPAVFHGGFSTFLVFLPLLTSENYVSNATFKILAMTIWIGLFNGLVVLPTVLSFLGPLTSTPQPPKPVQVQANNQAYQVD